MEGDFSDGVRAGYNGDRFVIVIKVRDSEEYYKTVSNKIMEKVNEVIPEGRLFRWDDRTVVFWVCMEITNGGENFEDDVRKHILTGRFVASMYNRLFDNATGEKYVEQHLLPPGGALDITFDSSDRIFYPLFMEKEGLRTRRTGPPDLPVLIFGPSAHEHQTEHLRADETPPHGHRCGVAQCGEDSDEYEVAQQGAPHGTS